MGKGHEHALKPSLSSNFLTELLGQNQEPLMGHTGSA